MYVPMVRAEGQDLVYGLGKLFSLYTLNEQSFPEIGLVSEEIKKKTIII